MGRAIEALVKAIFVITLIAAFITWAYHWSAGKVPWPYRYGCLLLPIASIAVLVSDRLRNDRLPDKLAKTVGKYLERTGLCFAFAPMAVDGRCWMRIFFQNRYQNGCRARIVLQPPRKSFSLGRIEMPGIDVTIHCEGGAFGLCGFNWAVPAQWQGKSMTFEVAADTTYPKGRGKRLRYQEGVRVGMPPSRVGTAVDIAVAGASILTGTIVISKPAFVSFTLPDGVNEAVPKDSAFIEQILWRPESPSGGFPVLPKST